MRNCMKEICNTEGQKMGYYCTYDVIVNHISYTNLGSNKKMQKKSEKNSLDLKTVYILHIHHFFLRNK